MSYRTAKICCVLLTCSWLQQYTGICRYFRVSHATINSTKYTKGSIIVYSVCDGLPVFGKITDILVTKRGECLFILIPHVTTSFNMHYHAYEVQPKINYIVCRQKDFADHHPLAISKSFDKDLRATNFIVMKYHIFHDI